MPIPLEPRPFDREGFRVRLRRARRDAGYPSFHAAARALGVSAHTLKAYEAGRALPNAERLVRIAAGYGVPVAFLLGDEEGTLPDHGILCDRQLVDRILATTDAGELARYLHHDPTCVLCMVEIPTATEVLTPEEALRLKERLVHHLERWAPEPIRAWRARHGPAHPPPETGARS